jgi:hypothetical protein
MRRPLGALLLAGLTAGLAPAASPTPVDALVERLGDPAFPERQAAARELLKRGSAALPTLEAAVKVHPDAETRMRAAALAEQIRRADDAARLVAAKTIKLDYRNTPLGSALADLKAKTGVPLTLDNKRVADPLRPITVTTDDLPAWAAIDAFCRAAGLVEVFREELGGSPGDAPLDVRSGRRSSYYGPMQTPTEPPGAVPVVLADGKPETLPGDRSTAVRVLALPPGFAGNRVIRGSGQVVLNLDVTPLPGVSWTDTAAVRVHRAEDETYRPVTASHRQDPKPGWGGMYDDGMVFLGAQAVWINGEVIYTNGGPSARLNPRVVPVTLRTDDRAIKTLRVFEGVVVGEITQPNQPLVTIDQLPKSVGATGHGPADNKLTVVDYKAEATQTVVKIRTESPNVWQLQRQGKRVGVMFANLTFGEGTSGQPDAVKVQFFDADGKPCGMPSQRGGGSMEDGFRSTREMELAFPKRPGVGAPVKLVVTGNKPVAVEVPFRMENVRLP